MYPVHCPGPEDSKKVSYVMLEWGGKHQDIQFMLKPDLEDIPDLPGHPGGVTKYVLGMGT